MQTASTPLPKFTSTSALSIPFIQLYFFSMYIDIMIIFHIFCLCIIFIIMPTRIQATQQARPCFVSKCLEQCLAHDFTSVQSLSHVWLFVTPWIAARQASLFITNSRSSLRLTSTESVMPSSHLILCRPLLLLPPIPPSIRVFSNESTLHMRWPKYWSFSFSQHEKITYRMGENICKLHSWQGLNFQNIQRAQLNNNKTNITSKK